MSNRKVLVLGASGFLGRNCAEWFGRMDGYDVVGTYFSRPMEDTANVRYVQADLRDPAVVDDLMKGQDIVIHMAAVTSGAKDIVSKPHIHVTDNVVMSSLIFRAAFDNKVKHLLFPSCTIMYQSSHAPLRENDFDPSDEIIDKYYGAGWTKVYLEKIAKFFAERGETKFTVFRHSNIYGPYDKYDLDKAHVFGATITKVLSAEDGSSIKVWGTGEEERDLLHVNDLMRFLQLAIDKQTDNYLLVNVGYGASTPIRDLVKMIIEASGKDLGIEYDPAGPTIKTKVALNCDLAREKLGWEPSITLREGIKMTLEWRKDNAN